VSHHRLSSATEGLNAAQREAVLALDGPCLVLAGAGSGKTRVITRKIVYLVRECGFDPRRVLAVTFTNKAAREMLTRAGRGLHAGQAKGLTIGTFHSLGLRLLREEAVHAGLKPAFSVLDAGDALAIVQDLLATTERQRLRRVQQTISLWKNALVSPQEALAQAADPDALEAARVYARYAGTLAAYQAVDFDDLISVSARLLEKNPEVRARWQDRVHYLLVDEYQDTNLCQYRMLKALTGVREQFTAVGDDDQAIYAWRGATVDNLMQLTRDYPDLKLIKLEQNYRSVERILAAANRLIGHNAQVFGKTLWSDLGAGEPIAVTPMDNEQAEAESIAVQLSAARFDRRAEWRDFAVLYRGNHQARVLEQALRNLQIPYVVSGGQSFFDRTEVRDVLSWLRLLANPDDDPAFIRAITTPRRGIGQSTLQALGQIAAREGLSLCRAVLLPEAAAQLAPRQYQSTLGFVQFLADLRRRAGVPVADALPQAALDWHGDAAAVRAAQTPAALLDELLAEMAYEAWLFDTLDEGPARRRWENVLELMAWLKRKAVEGRMDLLALVQHVALVSMLERSEDDDPDAVRLSTLHAAKGLEFPHVFLVGVEEGMLPHRGADDGDAEDGDAARLRIEEERRLMYVGITRARRSLSLSWCRRRRRAREEVVCEPSRFIQEMGLQAQRDACRDEAPSGISPRERLNRLKSLLGGSPV